MFNVIKNCEWIISYLKIFSREQLANYYSIKIEISNILYELLTLIKLSGEEIDKISDNYNEDWQKIISTIKEINSTTENIKTKSVFKLMRYQLYTILFHRLSDLQMCNIINENEICFYVNMYEESVECFGKDKFKNNYLLINFPDEEYAKIRFIKSIKAATMTSKDDIPCIKLDDMFFLIYKKYNLGTSSILKNELLREILYGIYMENTRMLYSGMTDLKIVLSDWLKNAFEKKILYPLNNYEDENNVLSQKIFNELSNSYIEADNNIGNIFYQNMLSNFVIFLKQNKKNINSINKENVIEKEMLIDEKVITYMFRYYYFLENLSKLDSISDNRTIPYIYEDVCRTLCGISGFSMCYIVLDNRNDLPVFISQSGYYSDYLKKEIILDVENICGIIHIYDSQYKFDDNEDKKEYTFYSNNETLFYNIKINEIDIEILSIKIPIDSSEGTNLYIVFEREKNVALNLGDEGVLTILRNVLFMRQTLVEVLKRDYIYLSNIRFDYSYIRPFDNDSDNLPSILHLSDLHIMYNLVDEEQIAKSLKGKIGNTSKKVDLLVISGDLVDGRNASAPIMEKRYNYAKSFLTKVVAELWEDNQGYLPHDWKKRVVISTGNHDYASMNQYIISLNRRELGPGTPIEDDSSTMSKFAYFLNFLIDFLNVPIDRLLENDLNEVRNYEKLNIKFFILNCSGNATPKRTNKLSVRDEKVKNVIVQSNWFGDIAKKVQINGVVKNIKPFRICLTHYSPEYKLSYFIDKYYDYMPGWEWKSYSDSPINLFVENFFIKAIESEYRYRTDNIIYGDHIDKMDDDTLQKEQIEFVQEYNWLFNALTEISLGNNYSSDKKWEKYFKYLLVENKKDSLFAYDEPKSRKNFVKKFLKSKMYQKIKKYYEWLNSIPLNRSDESISDLIMGIEECIMIGKLDVKNYKNTIDYINSDKPIDLFLAGHIHEYDECNYKSSKILVSDKMFNAVEDEPVSELKGYVIYDIIGADASNSDDKGICKHRRL